LKPIVLYSLSVNYDWIVFRELISRLMVGVGGSSSFIFLTDISGWAKNDWWGK